MDRANTAEWILRRLVNPARASEIVGDLLETQSSSNKRHFWRPMIRIFLILVWRTVTGILAASIAGVLLSWIPFAFTVTRMTLKGHQVSFVHSGFYIFTSLLLWIAAIFSLITFGFRSQLAALTFLAALLGAVATCTYWLPNATLILFAAALAFVMLSLSSASGRQVIAALMPALTVGASMMYLLGRIRINPRWPGSEWLLLTELLLVTTAECVVLSNIFQRFNTNESTPKAHAAR